MDNQAINWQETYDDLSLIDYNEIADIKEIEKEIFEALIEHPTSVEGLICFMQTKIMLGNKDKAIELAERIWGIGGDISIPFEVALINSLLNLGLTDYATILLKPRFEKIRENTEQFFDVMVKYALQMGGIKLLERLGGLANKPHNVSDDLFELVNVYLQLDYSSQFKNIQKIVMENCKENMCSYEYNLFIDRGFPEVEVLIYTDLENTDGKMIQEKISNKITAYWRTLNMKQLYNFIVSVTNIRNHASIYSLRKTTASDYE